MNVADVLTKYFEENSAALATQAKIEASPRRNLIEEIIDPLTAAAALDPVAALA